MDRHGDRHEDRHEKEARARIAALTLEDWQPLFDLIPEIESTERFGEWERPERRADGVLHLPSRTHAPVVDRFARLAYELPIVVVFDWTSWEEGRRALADADFDLDTLDLVDKCKLLTVILRSSRFDEGALVEAFQSGQVLKILRSIEREVRAKAS